MSASAERSFDAVLFDWCGTLVEYPLDEDRFRPVLRRLGRPHDEASVAELVAVYREAGPHPDAIEADRRCDLSPEEHRSTKLLICELVGDNPTPDTGAVALGVTTLILPLQRAPTSEPHRSLAEAVPPQCHPAPELLAGRNVGAGHRRTTYGGFVLDRTRALWKKQNESVGDRLDIFTAVAEVVDARNVLYAGCYVDITPSFVWPSVTYADVDKRANRFFADTDGVAELISEGRSGRAIDGAEAASVRWIHADYRAELDVADGSFDLLVSLYAGFVSEHCTRYLRPGGFLLVNPSHGDAAMASIDDRYTLHGVIDLEVPRGESGDAMSSGARVRTDELDTFLVPKRPVDITVEFLHASGKAVPYTRPAWAYLFQRIAEQPANGAAGELGTGP